jgi:ABC-type transport system involved in multi-copper enzyme maturation permease subunit
MNQTLALLLDAYRELNAKKLFWITLVLTAVLVGAFALVGVNDTGLTLAGATFPMPSPVFVYKSVFSFAMVGVWAKWASLILALVSTASIFPDLIAGGSIDLYLSKPISRWRLFLTKYATGLLFTALQVTVFAVGSFIVFGLRVHDWRPSLFLTIPLVLLLYSYLFCFCTLMGVMTRSTIAAILVTVLFWAICFGINTAEVGLFSAKNLFSAKARAYDKQVRQSDADLRDIKANHSVLNLFGVREQHIRERRQREQEQADEAKQTAEKLTLFHRIAYIVATVIPKTGETVDLLDRKLFSDADLAEARAQQGDSSTPLGPRREMQQPANYPPTTNPAEALAQAQEEAHDQEERRQVAREAAEETHRAARSRSVPWIIGTSLAFEAVIVAWAGWLFCRRDY